MPSKNNRILVIFHIVENSNLKKWEALLSLQERLFKIIEGYDYRVIVAKNSTTSDKLFEHRILSWYDEDEDIYMKYKYVFICDLDGFVLWNSERIIDFLESNKLEFFHYSFNFEKVNLIGRMPAGFMIIKTEVFINFLRCIKKEIDIYNDIGPIKYKSIIYNNCTLQYLKRYKFDEQFYGNVIIKYNFDMLKNLEDAGIKDINTVIGNFLYVKGVDSKTPFEAEVIKLGNGNFKWGWNLKIKNKDFLLSLNDKKMWGHICSYEQYASDKDEVINKILCRYETGNN